VAGLAVLIEVARRRALLAGRRVALAAGVGGGRDVAAEVVAGCAGVGAGAGRVGAVHVIDGALVARRAQRSLGPADRPIGRVAVGAGDVGLGEVTLVAGAGADVAPGQRHLGLTGQRRAVIEE
jgi:hypothetical protein